MASVCARSVEHRAFATPREHPKIAALSWRVRRADDLGARRPKHKELAPQVDDKYSVAGSYSQHTLITQ